MKSLSLSFVLCCVVAGSAYAAPQTKRNFFFEPKPAQYRGWAAIEADLSSRLAENSTVVFDFGELLGVPNGGGGRALLNLLGTSTEGIGYKGGVPGGVSFFLWYMAFDQLAANLSDTVCGPDPTPKAPYLSPEARESLRAACEAIQSEKFTPENFADAKQKLYAAWVTIAGYGVPFDEFEVWFESWKSLDPNVSAKDRFHQMLTLAWLNPYYLLQN